MDALCLEAREVVVDFEVVDHTLQRGIREYQVGVGGDWLSRCTLLNLSSKQVQEASFDPNMLTADQVLHSITGNHRQLREMLVKR